MLGVYDSHHLLDKLTGTLGLFAVLGPVRPHTIRPFYHPFYLHVTHARKMTGLLFRITSDGKLGMA